MGIDRKMTIAAFAKWKKRIAPVFDVANSIQLVIAGKGHIAQQMEADVSGNMPSQKAFRLADLEVDTLVCGAISHPLQSMITSCGIEVISFVAGDLQEVIQAWFDGKLTENETFIMPGCKSTIGCRCRGSRRMMRRTNKQ